MGHYPDGVGDGLLAEGDLAVLLEGLGALLLLRGAELRDVGVVALLYLLVDALQHRLLGQRLDGVLLDDAESSIGGPRGLAEVNTTCNI